MSIGTIEQYSDAWIDSLGVPEKMVRYPGSYLIWCEILECLLKTKRVLVVSAFADTMRVQARCLDGVHQQKFKFNTDNLVFYKAPQALSFSSPLSWYQNFEHMQREIAAMQFDIALIAAGGFGHPLLSVLADSGKSAIYVGGILQVVFGIEGARFDSNKAIIRNSYWCRPSADEKPTGFQNVEGGCYW
jgi:hypothetical protein